MIATDMISMAYDNEYDVAYLLSADGDYTPAVKKNQGTGTHSIYRFAKFGRPIKGGVRR